MCPEGQSHLEKEECLKQEVEEHVSNYFADTRKRVRLPPGHLKCQVSYILKPNRVHDFAEHKEGEHPESAENWCEEELQPRPDIPV